MGPLAAPPAGEPSHPRRPESGLAAEGEAAARPPPPSSETGRKPKHVPANTPASSRARRRPSSARKEPPTAMWKRPRTTSAGRGASPGAGARTWNCCRPRLYQATPGPPRLRKDFAGSGVSPSPSAKKSWPARNSGTCRFTWSSPTSAPTSARARPPAIPAPAPAVCPPPALAAPSLLRGSRRHPCARRWFVARGRRDTDPGVRPISRHSLTKKNGGRGTPGRHGA